MKKIMAVILTVIMLMSLCGMQSSAFTIKLPTVTGVKFVEASPVSMKDFENSEKLVEEYLDYIEDELGIDISDFEMFGDLLGELYDFYVEDGIVELTLSDGSVVEVDLEEGCYEIDRYTDINVTAYVKYDDYIALKESKAETVDVTFECSVYSYISSISKDSTFTLEADIVDCFVKEFKPVSTINYKLYEDSDIIDLEGKKFSVTYADGTKKTLTAKFDPEEGEYLLGDEHIYTLFSDNKVWFGYMDEIYEHSVTFEKENPYESIEITDYVFSETDGLTSISYVITDNKGKEKSFTVDTSAALADEELNFMWQPIAVFDSYYISIDGEDAYDADGDKVVGCSIYLEMGDLESEPVVLDYIEEDSRTLLEKIEDVIAAILGVFFLLFFPDEVM
ncbi:MAG: hypothetical protein IKY78_07300 [Clostridia bacterium]|nr:hypothetical protein [Clostridia bacterium]